jgi:23S rRNA (cytidine1920-2'-O)/16S rRNA (cytidine1409-2'-O)-methyltransferase
MTAKQNSDKGPRLDEQLVRRGFFASRSRARDAIERATVRVGGVVARKPGAVFAEDAGIEIDDPASAYVSRAALKLIAGLDWFGLDPARSVALDIGASTGGFTQVLLERGAEKVFAVDVGHDQMDQTLRGDPRVILREGVNARALTAGHLDGHAPGFLVCDASFISLKLALPPALHLAAPGAKGVFLVKPQFEAGRAAIGKGGILRNPEEGPPIAEEIARWLGTVPAWRVLGVTASPIAGGHGNREFLLGATKDQA